ncbi:Detected protein of confused Function [Hibiscus syriacus]|uniref:Detected protein of confused Function n=1 Tax=Hibiscus syriacus TaxID=106335 RepID=A0A6A3A0Q4_HIBSY|nr:Detected protein of confused Function [Hibiscus syriacus]
MKTEGKPYLIKKLADVKCQRVDESVVPGLEKVAQVENLLAKPNSEHVSIDGVLCFGKENLEKHLKMEDFFSCALDYSWKINCEASRILDKYPMMDLSHPLQCTAIYREEIHNKEQRPCEVYGQGGDDLNLEILDGLLNDIDEVDNIQAADDLSAACEGFQLGEY